MVNQDIVNYLIEGRKRGFGLGMLKQKLIEGGFEEDDIEEAIIALPLEKVIPNTVEKRPDVKKTSSPITQSVTKSSSTPDSCNNPSFFKKVSCALVRPRHLFERTADERVTSTLLFQELLSLIPFVVFSIGLVLLLYFFSAWLATTGLVTLFSLVLSASVLTIFFGSLAVAFFIVIPLSAFVCAGVTQLFVTLMKGQGHYSGTYKAVTYGAVPSFIISPFLVLISLVGPYGGFVAGILSVMATIWSFVLIVRGLAYYQKFSGVKAFFAVLLGIIFFIMVVVALILGAALLGPQPPQFGFGS